VGCGWCCLDNQCEESHNLHGYVKRCPELFFDRARAMYRCRLAAKAGFRALLLMGEGCCAPLNAWRENVRDRD
jgi:hypothetical protein